MGYQKAELRAEFWMWVRLSLWIQGPAYRGEPSLGLVSGSSLCSSIPALEIAWPLSKFHGEESCISYGLQIRSVLGPKNWPPKGNEPWLGVRVRFQDISGAE